MGGDVDNIHLGEDESGHDDKQLDIQMRTTKMIWKYWFPKRRII